MQRVDRIIDKIIRDLGIGQSEIDYGDYIEWIADALQHIGAYYQFEERECTIVIEDYQGQLPCELYKVIRMKKGCTIAPGEGGFYGGSLINALNNLGVDLDSLPAYEKYAIVNTKGLQKTDYVTDYDRLVGRLTSNANLIGDPTVNSFTSNDYNINFNKITTGFPCGIIKLQYLAFPVDERGWPLVPDDVSYRDALFWKVAYHLSMRNPKCLPNPVMQNLQYCKDKWDFYCKQARAAAYMPSLEMQEKYANNWIKLFNTVDDYKQEYRNTGKDQRLNLNGRY